jgi:hypothetical protein
MLSPFLAKRPGDAVLDGRGHRLLAAALQVERAAHRFRVARLRAREVLGRQRQELAEAVVFQRVGQL